MKEKIKDFYDLETWQKAYKLTLEIYKITQNFLLLAKDLGFINANICTKLMNKEDKARQLINGLIRATEKMTKK